jgi:hypothetical protein
MNSFSDLIGSIGASVLAAAIGAPYQTVASWKRRNCLPIAHWDRTLAVAQGKGIAVTKADLLRIAELRVGTSASEAA